MTANERHAELLEYIVGLHGLNPRLHAAASRDYRKTRSGLISVMKEQHRALALGVSNVRTTEELDRMAKEEPEKLKALSAEQRAIADAGAAFDDQIAAAYQACLERAKALWREHEFGERQDGPEMATETPQLAPDAQTQQREPGEEG